MQYRRLLRMLLFATLICLVMPTGQAMAFRGDDGNSDGCVSILRALRLKLLLLALVCCLLPGLVCTASWADTDNRPIVVFRIDDCPSSWNTPFVGLGGVSALTYGKSKQIPITWAVITSLATTGQSLSWAQLKDYLDSAGGEPASHSVTHAALSTQQAYIDELSASKAAIQANLPGYACNTFIQPGGWTNDANLDSFAKLDNPIGQAIQANYSQSEAYNGQGWHIGSVAYPIGVAYDWGLDTQDGPTVANLSKRLDVAAATPGAIIVLCGHQVAEQGSQTSYCIPADILKSTMDKLADLRDQGKIRLMSLNDAFHTTFSPDVNHIPDGGFEVSDPSIAKDPWNPSGGAAIMTSGGVGNSCYMALPNSSARLRSAFWCLAPGRYQMTWYQKVYPGMTNGGLYIAFNNCNNNAAISHNAMDWYCSYSNDPSDWEQHTALVLVPYRLNVSGITFQVAGTGGYGIDNLSLVSAPIDPNVSPSNTTATPSPGLCTLSWHTPNDPSITSIVVRYHTKTHPLTPTNGLSTSGTFLCSVVAQANTTQQIAVPFDWTTQYGDFFSVFGVRADGSYTPPDLADVWVDRPSSTTGPTTPVVSMTIDPDGTIHGQWSSTDAQSAIAQYQYALGTTSGASDVRPWTATTNTSAAITGLPWGTSVYLSVKAANIYGFWTSVTSVLTCPPPPSAPTVALSLDLDGTIHAQWAATDPVVGYKYAVGTVQGGSDVLAWINTTGTTAAITGIGPTFSGYVSVEAQNAYGSWSTYGYALTRPQPPISIAQAIQHPNNDAVTVTGVITAIFGDCYYIEDANRLRGIQIFGPSSTLHEGDTISVPGQIFLGSNGERAVVAN